MTLIFAIISAVCLPVAIVLGLYVVFILDKRITNLEKSQNPPKEKKP